MAPCFRSRGGARVMFQTSLSTHETNITSHLRWVGLRGFNGVNEVAGRGVDEQVLKARYCKRSAGVCGAKSRGPLSVSDLHSASHPSPAIFFPPAASFSARLGSTRPSWARLSVRLPSAAVSPRPGPAGGPGPSRSLAPCVRRKIGY